MGNSSQKSLRFNDIVEVLIIPATIKANVSSNRREIINFQKPRAERITKRAPSTRDKKKTTKSLTCINKRIGEIRVSRGNFLIIYTKRVRKLMQIQSKASHCTKGRSPNEPGRKLTREKQKDYEEFTRKSKFKLCEKTLNKSENSNDGGENFGERAVKIVRSITERLNSKTDENVSNVSNVLKEQNFAKSITKVLKSFYRMANRFFRPRGRGGLRGRGGHRDYAEATRKNPLFTMRVEISAVPPDGNPKQKRTHQMLACYLEPIIHGKDYLDMPRNWLDDKKLYPEESDDEEKLGHKWTLKLMLNKRIDMARFDKDEYTIGTGEHIWKFKIGGRDSATPKTRWRVMDGNRGFKWLPDIDMRDPTSYSTLLTEKIKEFVNGKVVMLGKVKVETTTMAGFKDNITGKLMFHTSEVKFQENELKEGKASSFKLQIYCGGYKEPINIWIQPLIPGNLKLTKKCKKCGLADHEEKDCTFEGPSYNQQDYSLYGQRAVEDIPGITKQIDEKKANLVYLAKTVLKKYENEKVSENAKTFGQLTKELEEVTKACEKLSGREGTSGKHQMHQLANLHDGEYSVNWDVPKDDMGRMAFVTKSLVNDNGANFNWIVVRGTSDKMKQEILTTGKLREILNGVTIQSLANVDRDRLVYLHELYETKEDPKRANYVDTLGENFVLATELVVNIKLEIYNNNEIFTNVQYRFRFNYYSHSRKRSFKIWTLSSPILKRAATRRNRSCRTSRRIKAKKRRRKK